MKTPTAHSPPWPVLNYGFRCFFLLAGGWAAVALAIWLWLLWGGVASQVWIGPDPLFWHAHEMLIGFVGAAMAGFLLTAVPAWTGQPPLQGVPLGVIAVAWLLGRAAMLLGGVLPALILMLVDLIFPIVLVILIARMLLAAANRRNYPLALIVVLFPLADVLIHLDRLGLVSGGQQALNALPHLAAVLVTIIGGRITPSFTTNWFRLRGINASINNRLWLERIIVPATVLTALLLILAPQFWLSAMMALISAVLHGLRLVAWRGGCTLSEPLLAVLHLGYGWLVLGYALLGLAGFGLFEPGAALHALTAGALGTMILAVMTRVALGHTGRELRATRSVVWAYGLVTAAVVSRVFTPWLGHTALWSSGLLWIAGFALFTVVYWPILTGPRADGKPERIKPEVRAQTA